MPTYVIVEQVAVLAKDRPPALMGYETAISTSGSGSGSRPASGQLWPRT